MNNERNRLIKRLASRRRRGRERLELRDRYNAVVQLHNQEFRTLGERSNAFLITQSIFMSALVYAVINRELFPNAFMPITVGISVVGIIFCIIHHLAGRSGSQAAFRWRRYMRLMEATQSFAPWNWTYKHCECKNHGEGLIDLPKRLTCEGCLIYRSPLPYAWLYTPAIFATVWAIAISHIVAMWYFKFSFTQAHPIATGIAFGVAVPFIIWRIRVWWKNRQDIG